MSSGASSARGLKVPDPVQPPVAPVAGERARNPLVKGSRQRSLFGRLTVSDPNPDSVARGRGGIKAYLDMLTDPYVKTAYTRKISETLEREWVVTPASESADHQEQARYIEWVFRSLRGSLYEDLAQMLTALLAGYSITEKVWEPVASGKWVGKWRVAALKTKDVREFGFRTDDYRNVVAVVSTADEAGTTQEYPPDQFVILTWMSVFENPYGTSDFQSAYRPYFLMKNLWVARAKYLERFAHPTPEGIHENGLTDAEIDEFQASLESLMDESVIIHSREYEINFLEAATDGAAYESAQQRLSTEIIISILGGHLNVIEGGLQGAKAQGEVHQASTSKGAEWVRIMLETAINEHLVVPLVRVNFGEQDTYPVWGFDRSEQISYTDALAMRQITEVLAWAQERGAEFSIEFLRDVLRIPAPREGETPALVPIPAPLPGQGLLDETDREIDPNAPMLSDFQDISISDAAQRNLSVQMRNLARTEALVRPRYQAAMRGYANGLVRELKKKQRVRS